MPHGNDDSKVFDVSKPHKITPSASSRPIIVGHHPIMADPMVLEERYHHPKPLHSHPAEQEKIQMPVPGAPDNTSLQESINPSSGDSQISAVSSPKKAYTTHGVPGQLPEQSIEKPPTEPSQIPAVAPIFDGDVSDSMNQKPDTNLPVAPQQPQQENPLHLPAGAARKDHTRNQIWLAIILVAVIVLMIFLAITFLLK